MRNGAVRSLVLLTAAIPLVLGRCKLSAQSAKEWADERPARLFRIVSGVWRTRP